MFSRLLVRNGAPAALPRQLANPMELQVRNASMKVIAEKMKSMENMKKITKAMKMVAAAKLKGVERRLSAGMPFVRPMEALFKRLPQEDKAGPVTLLAITSDKGLCGGVNSAVNKQCRLQIAEEESKGNAVTYMAIGSKGPAGMKRLYGDRFKYTFEETPKIPWNFTTASIIADRVSSSNPERLKIIGNKFVNMVTYNTDADVTITKHGAKTMDRAEWSKIIDAFEFEPPTVECWDDLHEFYYGSCIFAAQLQSQVTEESQRMTAMENASKNAAEMLDKYTLQYNRARQAKITTELCEIISGASAL